MYKYLNIKYCFGLIRFILAKVQYRSRLSTQGIFYLGNATRLGISSTGRITIKHMTYLSSFCQIDALGGNISIGSQCFFNTNNTIASMDSITIGDFCIFGPNVCIYDHNHGMTMGSIPFSKQPYTHSPIQIGNNVWLGANVVVLSGATIPDNCVVAANSTVTKSLQDGPGIYAGSPVRMIRKF